MIKKAHIINIGDELLVGQVINTNSVWLSAQLNNLNYVVEEIVCIGDDETAINKKLDTTIENNIDLIIITGGLGSTKDDITKKVLANYFNSPLVFNSEQDQRIRNFLIVRNKISNYDLLKSQSYLPQHADLLNNSLGIAAGMIFKKKASCIVSMPGVPHELKTMFHEQLKPLLINTAGANEIQHFHFFTAEIGESDLTLKLDSIENQLPPNMKLAYLPTYFMVRLRLTVIGNDYSQGLLKTILVQIEQIVCEHLISKDSQTLEMIIGEALTTHQKSIAVAESCTGGYISHLLSCHAGSSAFFSGGIIAYNNTVKENLLNIKHENLKKYGAVSKETVLQMASETLHKFNTTYALAISGILGPKSNHDDAPLGFVHVAIVSKNRQNHVEFKVRLDRQNNIFYASQYALLKIWQFIQKDLLPLP
ncbi:MAG: CinA family nicotinamide mononucleotide deamidase-related protein [Sediminibacterium sp.]|nr:CinA family nicotinamide mononucleotide deamidase-related protein [Sediminibacterium sp.]